MIHSEPDSTNISSLEMGSNSTHSSSNGSSTQQDDDNKNNATLQSIDDHYHTQRQQTKLNHWKESEYAAGLVEPTWSDELLHFHQSDQCCCCISREAAGQMFQEEIDPGCGCVYLSAVVCSRLGAGRIGNMAVLKERYVMVEVDDSEFGEEGDDEEFGGGKEMEEGFVEDGDMLHQRKSTQNGADSSTSADARTTKRLVRRREIDLIVGPFWPMLIFITYPLIFGVSTFALINGLPGRPLYQKAIWALLTFLLIRALFNTSFRDPGILRRHKNPPRCMDDLEEDDEGDRSRRRIGFRWGNEAGPWRWSDQAQSYRPRNAMYDPDCRVIVEEFDHT